MGLSLLDTLRDCALILEHVPAACYGRLQVRADGQPVLDPEGGQDGEWVEPAAGGCMPSFEGSDSEMIAGLIAKIGPEGSRYTEDRDDRFTYGSAGI